MKVDSIKVSCDSQLVVCQVSEEYHARGEKMVAYLNQVKELIKELSHFAICQVPHTENSQVDALARLASTRDTSLVKVVPVEYLIEPSITYHEMNVVMPIEEKSSWMHPILQYLKEGVLLNDKKTVKSLRIRVARYILYDDQLYKQGFSTPLLKCVEEGDADYILKEIHEEFAEIILGGEP